MHLHLGAAVGMLVYGPSISSLAIMVDHPEAYRLLTGAATVERVTGEKGTNYTLGGAGVHHRLSGEIELVFPAEEAAIHGARELVTVVRAREAIPATGGIMRRVELPQPEVPVSAGIILGREAIEANVDQGIFWETRDALKHAGGLLTGYAQLAGQPAVLAVTATDYGIHHGRAFKKMQLAAAAAQDLGLPLIVAVGANWDRLYPTARVETIYQQHEMRKAIREALIPKIGIALGPRSMEQNIHEIMDLVWYVERGNETVYERQRASLLTHGVTDRFATAMDWCADILRYLRRPWEGARQLPTDDPADRLVPELAGLLPANLNRPYNMRDLIALIFDAGSFREFSPADQQPLHVGLATLCGRVVGVIADAPN
ncbi:MAG: hypothetical protein HYV03_01880, partial [Deltaproteobacteria bacterium]|nr:hypothetical protein [Deltaproteobacteria bacterium]